MVASGPPRKHLAYMLDLGLVRSLMAVTLTLPLLAPGLWGCDYAGSAERRRRRRRKRNLSGSDAGFAWPECLASMHHRATDALGPPTHREPTFALFLALLHLRGISPYFFFFYFLSLIAVRVMPPTASV